MSETEQVQAPGDLEPASIESLPQALREACKRMGWSELMPVQSKAIPYVLDNRDLMVQSRTGSGKTGAFILPMMAMLDPRKRATQALVMAPTRELAVQVHGEAKKAFDGTDLNLVLVYGGVGYGPQLSGLKAGAHLVVGTPGRILDHLMRGTFTLNDLQILVLDEADRLMSMGFYPDMVKLRGFLPRRRLGYMFSATYPVGVLQLGEEFLHQAEFLNLSQDTVHVAETDHVYFVADVMEKDRALVRVIEVENPDSAIIFCNTKAHVEYVSEVLKRFGYEADMLTSDLRQSARETVLRRLREKRLRLLVATDVAARGIDIEKLSHVILYDFPDEAEGYIHRAGRTGRAGAVGVVMSLVGRMEEMALQGVAKQYGIDMEQRPLPTDEDVRKIVAERTTVLLEMELRSRDQLQKERLKRMIGLAASLGESDDELAVIAMLLDDFYQQTLHQTSTPAPSEPSPASPPQRQRPSGGNRRGRRRSGGRSRR